MMRTPAEFLGFSNLEVLRIHTSEEHPEALKQYPQNVHGLTLAKLRELSFEGCHVKGENSHSLDNLYFEVIFFRVLHGHS